jgi:predicted tellurium resistance membrane protein TerC
MKSVKLYKKEMLEKHKILSALVLILLFFVAIALLIYQMARVLGEVSTLRAMPPSL